jgi:CRP-like cAMP-binding protein
MNKIELKSKSIEALKLFNNTIVTSRIYPPEAPQVTAAVDRGYKGIKLYLRLYGDLKYSLVGGAPCLCGQLLEQEVLDLFPNLVIYRQLRLLGLSHLVMSPEMDRFAFGQLLTVFNASIEKIKIEGDGAEYITSLGLASFFPEETGDAEENPSSKNQQNETQSRKLMIVRPEMVACLFGKDKRPVIETELQKKMADSESAIDMLAACVAHSLQDIQKKKMIVASHNFPLMLKKAEKLIEPGKWVEVALGLAKVLVENLKEPALCVLAVQEYPDGFGSTVYDRLISSLTTEQLSGIMIILREQLAKARRVGGTSSSQVQCLGKAMLLLMNSKKGKHFLGSEKAKNIIHEGERERKKRRIEAGLKGFLQGNTSLLKSEELVDYLPEALRRMKTMGSGDASSILNGMVGYLSKGPEEEVKKSLLKSLVTIGEDLLLGNDQWHHIDLILEPLMEEVRNDGFGESLMEKCINFLQQVMQKSWQDGENHWGDVILSLFHQIRSGQIHLTTSTKTIAAKIQDRGIRRARLPQLLADCLAAPKDKTLNSRLILQGPVVLRFLVESLINTDNAADRIKIIDLLTYSPKFLPSVVHERLKEHMPWYAKRNLIKLLGETGKEEDAESILPYLCHDDFRVQREAFLTIYKISGNSRKRLLLRALEESPESIKIQVVQSLANFCDSEVAAILIELLVSHEQFGEPNRNNLLLQILETLGRCPCLQAQKGVYAFLQTKGQRGTRKISEQVWAGAERAYKFLQNELQETRKKHVQASQLRKNALKQAAKLSKTATTQRVITGLQQEQAIRTLLSRGDKTAALEQVLELIERASRLRNFVQAQKLKEWLVEIDPTALSQIVRAAEIIDQEKIASIDKSHFEIWNGLYDILTTEEFSAVYHALRHKKYENEEIIISQGSLHGSLFFINSGKVKLYFDDQGSEVLVNTMGSGQIFGEGAFFEVSAWTISVASIGISEISILNLDTLQEWTENFPGLESKLKVFCKKFEKIEELIKRSSHDRRSYKRYRITGQGTATLLDNSERGLGTNFMSEVFDISEGGLSFLLRISKKENARLMLGRKMLIKLSKEIKSQDGIALVGDILAVKNTHTLENDYSLHMKFDNLLDRKQLHDIVMVMREESQVID